MAYTITNFKTKTFLKRAVKHANEFKTVGPYCYNPGLGPDLSNFTGKVYLEGPHYPAAHTWYAEAELRDGRVVKVK
jgi:hypothetical protein